MTLYFDAARFWGDTGFVLGLTPEELLAMVPHIERIAEREARARRG